MRHLIALITVALLFLPNLAFGGFFTSFYTDGVQQNTMNFKDWEVVLHWNGSAYEDVNLSTTVPGVGDVVAQVYRATIINGDTNAFDTYELTAYSALKIKTRTGTGTSGDAYVFEYTYLGDTSGSLAALSDPFADTGLTGFEAVRWFLDPQKNLTDAQVTSGTRQDTVDKTTDGTFFASFGFGAAADGAASGTPYVTSVSSVIDPTVSDYYTWLNVLALGSDFSGITFPGVYKSNSTSMYATGNVAVPVPGDPGYGGPWMLYSTDPTNFRMTPEPSALIGLIGLVCVSAFGLACRRRR